MPPSDQTKTAETIGPVKTVNKLTPTAQVVSDVFKSSAFKGYVGSYINIQTGNKSPLQPVSRIPTTVPIETLIALTAYDPGTYAGYLTPVVQQARQQANIQTVQAAIAQRLQSANILSASLANYIPAVPQNLTAIQRRENYNSANIPSRIINGVRVGLNPRELILRGVDPKTRALIQQLEDLKLVNEFQQRLRQITDKLEKQINIIAGVINAIVNAPDAAISGALTLAMAKLTEVENLYLAAKRIYLVAKRIKDNIKKAILKIWLTDIPKLKQKIQKALSLIKKILKLKEIPRLLRWPKLPKLPTINLTTANFYAKAKKAIKALRSKNNEFYQKAYAKAVEQAGVEIVGNKDPIEKAFAAARGSLRDAKLRFDVAQARRNAVIEKAKNDYIRKVKTANSATEAKRAEISEKFSKNRKAVQAKLDKLLQVGSGKVYIPNFNRDEALTSTRIDLNVRNIFGDSPLPYVQTNASNTVIASGGYITIDGRTIFEEPGTGNVYVLESAKDRIEGLVKSSISSVQGIVREVQDATDAFKNLVDAYGTVKNGFNDKVLAQQFGSILVQETQNIDKIADAAQSPDALPSASKTDPLETFHNAADFEITTIARDADYRKAVSRASDENKKSAEQYGYTNTRSKLDEETNSYVLTWYGDPELKYGENIRSFRTVGPVVKNNNGQNLYEVTIIASFKVQTRLAKLQNFGRITPTRVELPSILTTPITGPTTAEVSVSPLQKIYKVIGSARLRSEPSETASYKTISSTVPLKLLSVSFTSKDGYLYGNFKVLDGSDATGWIINHKVSPPPGPFISLPDGRQIMDVGPKSPQPPETTYTAAQKDAILRKFQELVKTDDGPPIRPMLIDGDEGPQTYRAITKFNLWDTAAKTKPLTTATFRNIEAWNATRGTSTPETPPTAAGTSATSVTPPAAAPTTTAATSVTQNVVPTQLPTRLPEDTIVPTKTSATEYKIKVTVSRLTESTALGSADALLYSWKQQNPETKALLIVGPPQITKTKILVASENGNAESRNALSNAYEAVTVTLEQTYKVPQTGITSSQIDESLKTAAQNQQYELENKAVLYWKQNYEPIFGPESYDQFKQTEEYRNILTSPLQTALSAGQQAAREEDQRLAIGGGIQFSPIFYRELETATGPMTSASDQVTLSGPNKEIITVVSRRLFGADERGPAKALQATTLITLEVGRILKLDPPQGWGWPGQPGSTIKNDFIRNSRGQLLVQTTRTSTFIPRVSAVSATTSANSQTVDANNTSNQVKYKPKTRTRIRRTPNGTEITTLNTNAELQLLPDAVRKVGNFNWAKFKVLNSTIEGWMATEYITPTISTVSTSAPAAEPPSPPAAQAAVSGATRTPAAAPAGSASQPQFPASQTNVNGFDITSVVVNTNSNAAIEEAARLNTNKGSQLGYTSTNQTNVKQEQVRLSNGETATKVTVTTRFTQSGASSQSSRKIIFVGDSLAVGTASRVTRQQNSPVRNVSTSNSQINGRAVGTAFLQVAGSNIETARVGAGTRQIIQFANNTNIQNADVAIISAGSNDPIVSNGRIDAVPLRSLRETLKAKKYIWIVPIMGKARDIVKSVAAANGDRVVEYTGVSSDGVHPSDGYASFAQQVITALGAP